MDTYTIGRSSTGHYRKPGMQLTYCGRTVGTPAPPTACAPDASRPRPSTAPPPPPRRGSTSPPTSPLMAAALASAGLVEAVDNRRAAAPAPTLFDVKPKAEQGALSA
ncbi:hypothetical protein ACIP96_30490 [Streptomyces nigra]|uniref:hypothetical protein n=1 Tax=Streptomyces nigra TaxID=1827580 RepID=UPI0038272BBE